jgi:hypothetical protein
MEEQFKNEDRIIRKLVTEAGLERPSAGFSAMVMQKIDEHEAEKVQYTPLISKRGWWIFSIGVCLAFVLIWMLPAEGTQSPISDGFSKVVAYIPEFQLPGAFLYSTLFLALFILQIPLLKKYLDGQVH